jgi:mRNA interferase MazF
MKRGEIYRVTKPPGDDPKKHRYFVVVSRNALVASRFSTLICAPIYSSHDGLSTQVPVGVEEGLQHESSIHCDALVSITKSALTHFVGTVTGEKLKALNKALVVAVDIEGNF